MDTEIPKTLANQRMRVMLPMKCFQTEICLDNLEYPVSEQNFDVGEPDWNDGIVSSVARQ